MVKADDTAICKCEKKCGKGFEPVCGSNRKTYQNECELKHHTCVKKMPTEVPKKGYCSKFPSFVHLKDLFS